VRAYNVLRQYEENAALPALTQTAEALDPGGLLIEGTCNPTGAMVAFDVWRREPDATGGPVPGLAHVALVFGTNLRESHEPADYQTILPKRLIHRMLDPEPARFFADWRRATDIARAGAAHAGRREQWAQAAEQLRERGWPVDVRRRLLARGFLALGATL
jgi:hypothetical protein